MFGSKSSTTFQSPHPIIIICLYIITFIAIYSSYFYYTITFELILDLVQHFYCLGQQKIYLIIQFIISQLIYNHVNDTNNSIIPWRPSIRNIIKSWSVNYIVCLLH